MSYLVEWGLELWAILAQSGPFLLLGLALAGLLGVLVPQAAIVAHLGRNDFSAVGKAALLGAPIPLCSCSVLPTAAALRRAGASKGATSAFLISTPETGVDSIGITWALTNPVLTVARPLAAIATALASGLAVNLMVRRGWEEERPAEADSADCACQASEDACESEPAPTGGVARRAARYAFGTLMADLAPWLAVGLLLSALIAVFVPSDFFGTVVPDGAPAMGLMLLVGIPTYVCATASTPVAAALIAKGLEPGAALVFLLAGPATNLATIAVVRGLLGNRVAVVYLVSIAALALGAGALLAGLDRWFDLGASQVVAGAAGEAPGPLNAVGGGLLGLLIVAHLIARRARRQASALDRDEIAAGDETTRG